jgi:hypothetical protein
MRIHSLVLPCLLAISACAWSSEATGSRDPAKEFQAEINKYVAIQKKAVASVPAIGKDVTDAALIATHEKQVADAIRALRPNAKQGDLFTPNVAGMIKTTVKQKVDGNVDAKASVLGEGNPQSGESPAPVNLVVNATYPVSAPLSTVPPSVLMALPTLPKELEFRFVGRNLILRDTRANMIVDVLPNVF